MNKASRVHADFDIQLAKRNTVAWLDRNADSGVRRDVGFVYLASNKPFAWSRFLDPPENVIPGVVAWSLEFSIIRIAQGGSPPLGAEQWSPGIYRQPLANSTTGENAMTTFERDDTLKLGDKAKDQISGFSGTIVAITEWLNGCRRITIQPSQLHEGRPVASSSFDAEQVAKVEEGPALSPSRTGGPVIEPERSADPA